MQNYLSALRLGAVGATALTVAMAAGNVSAEETKLRIQTHFSPETPVVLTKPVRTRHSSSPVT